MYKAILYLFIVSNMAYGQRPPTQEEIEMERLRNQAQIDQVRVDNEMLINEANLISRINQATQAYYQQVLQYLRQLGETQNDSYRAVTERMLAVGQFRKLSAEANLLAAQTIMQIAKVQFQLDTNRFWKAQVDLFIARQRRYFREERLLHQELTRLRRYANHASRLKGGRTDTEAIHGFHMLVERLPSGISRWEPLKVVLGPFDGDNFYYIKRSRSRASKPIFASGNIFKLLDFLKDHRMGVERGSDAYFAVVDAYDQLESDSRIAIESLMLQSEELLSTFLAIIDQLGLPNNIPSSVDN